MFSPRSAHALLQSFRRRFREMSGNGLSRSAHRGRMRGWNVPATEYLEERIVPSTVMTDTSLRFKAFPGEQNDVKVTPGFLTFLRDASDVSLIPSPGSLAFSTN
ncbi:MAG: hypothetical protein KDA68_13910, partial [Planctomycetaceae bacterium]|nr:hypothetical protein [Planctomycetaceae bacterium]